MISLRIVSGSQQISLIAYPFETGTMRGSF